MLKNGWYLLIGIAIIHVVVTIGSAQIEAYRHQEPVAWAFIIGTLIGSGIGYLVLGGALGGLIYLLDRYVVRRNRLQARSGN